MAVWFGSEFDWRRRAVQRVRRDGWAVAAAAREVGRSRQWLHKWLGRYDASGEGGLKSLSRAPHRRPTATPLAVVARVLEVRTQLEAHPFANRGAEAVRWELAAQDYQPVPSEATIDRVLHRAGVTRRAAASARSPQRRPLPSCTEPGCWQQIDWVGPRFLSRQVRFSSLHLVDVGGGGAAAAQYPDERLLRTVSFLTERAWPTLSIPLHLQTDGAFVPQPPGPAVVPFNSFVRCCLFFGVEVIISPPQELGWQNWVESFNGLWQARTIRRHTYSCPEEVSADSDRFIDYYLWHKPCPRLRTTTHQTRFPGQLIETRRHLLRFPPDGFNTADHLDHRGQLHIPLARGRLSYLCRVQPGGIIDVARAHFSVPAATTGLVVCATILTGSRRLVIRHGGDIIATHPFPIPEPTTDPYHPPAPRGLFYFVDK